MDAPSTIIIPNNAYYVPDAQNPRVNRYEVNRSRTKSLPSVPLASAIPPPSTSRVQPSLNNPTRPLYVWNKPPASPLNPPRTFPPVKEHRRLHSEGVRTPSPLRSSYTAEALQYESGADENGLSFPRWRNSVHTPVPFPIPDPPPSPPPPTPPPKDVQVSTGFQDTLASFRVTRFDRPRPIIRLDDSPSPSRGRYRMGNRLSKSRQNDRRPESITPPPIFNPSQIGAHQLYSPRPLRPSEAISMNNVTFPGVTRNEVDNASIMEPTFCCIPTQHLPNPFERPAKGTPNILLLQNRFSGQFLPPAIEAYANRAWPRGYSYTTTYGDLKS